MNPFEALGARQSSALEQLRLSVADNRDAVTLLLETSCLLEVARLASTTTDLQSYLDSVSYVVTQFLGSATLALYVAPLGPDGPVLGSGVEHPEPLLDRAGAAAPGANLGADGMAAYGLRTPNGCSGFIAATGLAGVLEQSTMLVNVAKQISEGLDRVLANEQLRRQAAASQLTRLLNELPEGYDEGTLAQFVKEMVYLDGVAGVRLELESPHLGGVVVVTAGAPFTEAAFVHEGQVDGRLPFRLLVGAVSGGGAGRLTALTDIAEQVVSSLSRVEETRRLRSEIETDPLTGVGNRRRAGRALTSALARADRTGESLAVLLLDLDYFKLVNDNFGHPVGDEVLRAVSAGLAVSLRPSDTMARMGGEEFLLVCPGADMHGALAIAQRVLRLVPVLAEPALPSVWRQTASVGVALYPRHAVDADRLLLRADEALYRAKREGRDRWILADTPGR